MSRLHPKSEIELLEVPVEVCILRDGKALMTQVFQHTPIRFGRILDNDIVLPFDGVSRHHCELRFQAEKWTLEDLKSLNGVSVNGERVSSATFDKLGEFELKPVMISLKIVKPSTLSSQDTLTGSEPVLSERISSSDATVVGEDPQSVSAKRLHAEKPKPQAARDAAEARARSATTKRPLLEINGISLMGEIHPFIEKAKARAVQVTVLWHEVLLSVDEFLPGEEMMIEINGIRLRLGRVGRDRSEIRCPTGTTFVDRPGNESMLLPSAPATWMAKGGLQILARYAPQSRRPQPSFISFVESELVDPLVVSGIVHGALALATVTIAVKETAKKAPPERVARIIASMPAPTPTPKPFAKATPPPVPTATPPPIAKATPKPTPVAIATPKPVVKADPTPPPKVEKKVAHKITPKAPPKAERKLASRPPPKAAPPESAEKSAPTPIEKPIAKATPPPATAMPKPFDAASVGALKALSILSANKDSTPNVEKIIVRKTASSGDSANAPPTTAQMMNGLPKGETRPTDGSVGGLSLPVASGSDGYGTAGYSSKTGKRNVLGSVIGGATFTAIAKTEGLSREQVMKVVQKHQSQIQQCYERALMDDSTLTGRAEFEWEINSKGAVTATSVTVKETNLKRGEKLIDCVKGIFRAMKFPTSKNGETTTPTIGLPFGRL